MKLLILAAAGLTLTGLAPVAIATPAVAQERTIVRERTVVRHEGPRFRHRDRTVCRTVYRHHHRERVCRQVRR